MSGERAQASQASDPVSLSVIRARGRTAVHCVWPARGPFYYIFFLPPLLICLCFVGSMTGLACVSFGAAGNCYRCPVIIGPLWPSRALARAAECVTRSTLGGRWFTPTLFDPL